MDAVKTWTRSRQRPRMKPSAEKQQQKAVGSSVGSDIESETDGLDESESSPREQLRMNIPTLNTQCFGRRTQSRTDSPFIFTHGQNHLHYKLSFHKMSASDLLRVNEATYRAVAMQLLEEMEVNKSTEGIERIPGITIRD